MSRAFVGEWIFSQALFDWDAAHDERYLAEVLLTPPSWLGRNPSRPPSRGEVRAILEARDAVRAFVDWCAERVVDAQPRIVGFTSVFQQHLASLALAKRIKRCGRGLHRVGGANCEATIGHQTVSFPFVDAVVSGEADHVFADLALQVWAGPRGPRFGVIAGDGRHPSAGLRAHAGGPPPRRPSYRTTPAFRPAAAALAPVSGVFVKPRRHWWGERMHCRFAA
jgi:hypothetical protein